MITFAPAADAGMPWNPAGDRGWDIEAAVSDLVAAACCAVDALVLAFAATDEKPMSAKVAALMVAAMRWAVFGIRNSFCE